MRSSTLTGFIRRACPVTILTCHPPATFHPFGVGAVAGRSWVTAVGGPMAARWEGGGEGGRRWAVGGQHGGSGICKRQAHRSGDAKGGPGRLGKTNMLPAVPGPREEPLVTSFKTRKHY